MLNQIENSVSTSTALLYWCHIEHRHSIKTNSMLHHIVILLSVFICVSLAVPTVQAQEEQTLTFDNRVVYNLSYQRDSMNVDDVRSEQMELLIGDSISLFRSVVKGRIDSVTYLQSIGRSNVSFGGRRPYSEFHYQILKTDAGITMFDVLTNSHIYSGANHFYFKESKDIFEWELQHDTMRIQNVLCQRATLSFGNRHWTAWFAPAIPIADGPYKFGGLPGLIVRIHDEDKQWVFDLVAFDNFPQRITIHFDERNKPEETTKGEFLAKKKKFQENEMHYIELNGDINFSTAEDRRIIHQNVNEANRQNNNWIELY